MEIKSVFLGMLLGTVDASLFGNLFTGKRTTGTSELIVRVGETFYCRFIIKYILKFKNILELKENGSMGVFRRGKLSEKLKF